MSSPVTSPDFVLYGYFRSSAAFRVRIALNLKGISAEQRFVHLLRDGGEHHGTDYKAINPQELVPALVHDGETIGQSLAIIEYLDEVWPEPPLLPLEPRERARVRQLSYIIACDIHPLNNLRLLLYLRDRFSIGEEARSEWQRHWISLGFSTLETLLSQSPYTGLYCHGDSPTLADICLIPQMANARRVNLDLAPYPTLMRIEAHALAHPAFEAALPKTNPMPNNGRHLDLDRFVPYRLSVLTNRISNAIARHYSEQFGLSIAEWRVMAVLSQSPGLSASEVALRTEMDKVQVSRAVTSLVRRRRVHKTVDGADGRVTRLALNSRGQTIYNEIVPQALELEEQFLAALDSRERAAFHRLIDKLSGESNISIALAAE